MKKITMVAVMVLLLYQTKAQIVSVNYVKQFVSDSKSSINGVYFAPYTVSSFSVAYSQTLKNSPITINLAVRPPRRNPPPRFIKYPDPPVYGKYAKDNKIEADSAGFSDSKARSLEILAGAGYILPHKANSKFFVTVNADFGVAFNDNTSLDFYLQGRKTGSAKQKKTEFIISPSVQAKYFITNNIGVNIIAGYDNRGGVNAGVGIVIGKKSSYVGHVTLLK